MSSVRDQFPAPSSLVLGLDLGPNSVGWALVDPRDRAGSEPSGPRIVAAGVRVFEAGLENYGSSKEQSRAQKRRAARSARRTSQRRRRRRHALRGILQRAGLLPVDPEALRPWLGPFRRGDRGRDPYALRARGLDTRLDACELGVAIYHIAKRRGFRSNRKDASKAREDGMVLDAIGTLRLAIRTAACRTIGEYLWRLRQGDAEVLDAERARGQAVWRVRGRHTERAMLLDELRLLCDRQRAYHPTLLTSELERKLEETIFHQRPYEVTQERADGLARQADGHRPRFANLLRSPAVGLCPLVEGERRIWKGDWRAQRFRLLKDINDLRLQMGYQDGRKLAPAEREALVAVLGQRRRVPFDKLRETLSRLDRALDQDSMRFSLERGARKELLGNSIEHALARAHGAKAWAKVLEAEKNRLRAGLSAIAASAETESAASAGVDQLFGPGAALVKREALLQFGTPDGYLKYSARAIDRLLPHMENGLSEFEAVEREFPGRGRPPRVASLPHLGSDITNPVVRRAIGQARRVVNAILKEYGLPARIQVELGRAMALTGEQRRDASRRMREREQERQRAGEMLMEWGIASPRPQDVLTYELWREQGGRCPYSGLMIGQSTLVGHLSGSGALDVDHILPRWRSGDDSYLNKVVCYAEVNRRKGDRTPMEAIGDSPTMREEFEARVRGMRGLSRPKQERLLALSIPEGQFIARQLNDTRYMATELVAYLNQLYDEELRVGQQAVGTAVGRTTAQLRRLWGLDGLLPSLRAGKGEGAAPLSKREDHRHHAVDALVVALTTRAHVQRLSDDLKAEATGPSAGDTRFAPPWPSLRADALSAIGPIHVSHCVDRRIRGAFHKEKFYGETLEPGRFAYRVPVGSLKPRDLSFIRDDEIRSVIERHLETHGWTPGQDFPKGALTDAAAPPRMKSGVPVRRVRIWKTIRAPLALGGEGGRAPHRHAEPDGNHHVAIVDTRGLGRTEDWRAVVVPMHLAARRIRQERLQPVDRALAAPQRFVCALHRKDSVLVTDPDTGEELLCVVQKLGGTLDPSTTIDVTLRDARDAREASVGSKSPVKRLNSLGALAEWKVRPVTVSPLGRVLGSRATALND